MTLEKINTLQVEYIAHNENLKHSFRPIKTAKNSTITDWIDFERLLIKVISIE